MQSTTRGFGILLAAAAGLMSSTQLFAQEDPLAITFDNTYSSKYMWRGYDLFESNGAWMPSIDFDLWGTGWNVNVWSAVPLGSGSEELTELDYTFGYATTLFEEEMYQLDLGANWIYYDFPKANGSADTVEWGLGGELPNVFGDLGLVPSFYFGWLSAAENGATEVNEDSGETEQVDIAGQYYSFGLSYDFEVMSQAFNIYSDVAYNGGLFGAPHGFSHTTVTLSTGWEFGMLSLTPFLSYQYTCETELNDDGDENELWGGLSATLSF